jgi:primosomal replication protein N
MTLQHASVQAEAGGERKVDCEIAAVAFAEVALALAKVIVGAELRCQGFIARRYRTGTSLALHLTRFELTAVPTEQD